MCATLDHSLHAKLGITLEENDQTRSTGQASSTGQTTCNSVNGSRNCGVNISDEKVTKDHQGYTHCGHTHRHVQRYGNDIEEGLLTSRQRARNERPCSLPSLHLKDNLNLERLEALRQGQNVRQEVDVGQQEVRSRSKSQDDCYHRDWCGQQHHCDGHRQHRASHRSARRRRAGRTRRERNDRVDISLDDNCPGLAQNRVTRRGRQHHHQHSLCQHCQDKLRDQGHNSACSRRHRRRQVQSPTGEQVFPDSQEMNDSSGWRSGGEGEDGIGETFMTLQDIKMVTSDFLKGANDLDESVIKDLKMQFLRGMEEQQRHNQLVLKKGGHETFRVDPNQSCLSRNKPRTKSFHFSHGNWQQLALPTEPRTGQDSPRTDMAVFNLDLNSTSMCQPIVVPDPSSTNDLLTSRERGGQVYLHQLTALFTTANRSKTGVTC